MISPEGGAAILWGDAGEAKKAAAAFKPDAGHCLELGVIDGIVPEPPEGARKPRLTVTLIGLTEAAGVLPRVYTDLLSATLRNGRGPWPIFST